jgi:DNA-binding winged helix-turn-helix (wHTH) protein/GGDEF domain-containing protein
MGHVHMLGERFVLDNRWLFDVERDQLTDLTGCAPAVTLTPIVTRMLTLFARAPRQTLTRRFLFENGWKAFGFEVCENSLNQVICTLRCTFAALDPQRSFFKTIPRIGYCLLVDACPQGRENAPAPVEKRLGPATTPQPDEPTYPSGNLINRQEFDVLLETELQRASHNGQPLSLLMIDIRELLLSGIYDDPGCRAARTRLSTYLSRRLFRARDRLAYYSETIFAALLPETSSQGAACVAQRLRIAMSGFDGHRQAGLNPRARLDIGLADNEDPSNNGSVGLVGAAIMALREGYATA